MKYLHLALLVVFSAINVSRAADPPTTANGYISRGMQRFRENKVAESIEDFDRAAALQPQAAPHLWQRGISYYYTGEYLKGRQQFEIHKAVNPHDVENATWHFICVARLAGLEAAQEAIIEIDTSKDTRIPMAEVYELYAGRGSAEQVLAAMQNNDSERARMYGYLYLGLFYEVAGQPEKAREHMQKSAAAKLQDNYMHQVAKIHLKQRQWETKP